MSAPGSAFGLLPAVCPDCGERVAWSHLVHAATCPLALGMDAVIDGDRDWFMAHPGTNVRRRPVTPAEIADAVASGLARPVGAVTVYQLTPGVRSRRYEYADGAL